jgi:PAS domain S-box-containing protein
VSKEKRDNVTSTQIADLREIADKYRLLIEAADTGFVILDEAGQVLDANAEYVRLSGRERLEQILGRPVTQWTTLEHRERNATAHPRQDEQSLRCSQHQYRATIDAMVEIIHVVDSDLRIELINRTGNRWLLSLGVCPDVVGKTLFDVFPFLPDSIGSEYRRVFDGKGPLITEETTVVDGQDICTETRKIPIIEDGQVVRVVTVIRDVTEAVRTAERLRHTEKMEALGQLAGGIAHDFNNQLTAVLGYAQLLMRKTTDPVLRDYASAIVGIATRTADLTRQLLSFARKGRGRFIDVDIHELLEELGRMLSRTLGPHIDIQLRNTASRFTVSGDPTQLHNALLNLALNARDAMPRGGVLAFDTDVVPVNRIAPRGLAEFKSATEVLRIRVSDTGTGMSEETRRRIFEPFFTTKEPGQGTGLGLAAVYGTMKSHQGTVCVDSELGRGSAFTLFLPLVEAQPKPTPSAVDVLTHGGPAHVLIVDDEIDVLRATEQVLVALGFRVSAHSDGATALSSFRESWSQYDLVLLDVMMPQMDGPSILREMRRIHPGVRAVFYSGYPLSCDCARLVDEGNAVFLAKPFTMTELTQSLLTALEQIPGRTRSQQPR